MPTQTQAMLKPAQDQVAKEKVRQLRELFADAPEVGGKRRWRTLCARSNPGLAEAPPPPIESAGRVGARQGKVSELPVLAPFSPGGAKRLRTFLQLLGGELNKGDKVGTLRTCASCFWTTIRRCSSPLPLTAIGTPTSTISWRRFLTLWISSIRRGRAGQGFAARGRKTAL